MRWLPKVLLSVVVLLGLAVPATAVDPDGLFVVQLIDEGANTVDFGVMYFDSSLPPNTFLHAWNSEAFGVIRTGDYAVVLDLVEPGCIWEGQNVPIPPPSPFEKCDMTTYYIDYSIPGIPPRRQMLGHAVWVNPSTGAAEDCLLLAIGI